MATPTTDSQSWIYPPGGAAVPPLNATGQLGPVHLGDSILLDWTPRIAATVRHACLLQSTTDPTGGTSLPLVSNAIPPLLVEPTWQAANQNSADKLICHLFFTPSQLGNTITWEYDVDAAEIPTTWSARYETSTTVSSSSTTASPSTSSLSNTSATASSSTSSLSTTVTSESTAVPEDTGLPTGAKAGVGVGVALAVLAFFAFMGFLLYRHKKYRRREQSAQCVHLTEQSMATRISECTIELDGYPKNGYHDRVQPRRSESANELE